MIDDGKNYRLLFLFFVLVNIELRFPDARARARDDGSRRVYETIRDGQ